MINYTFLRDGANVTLSEDPTKFPGATITDVATEVSFTAGAGGSWAGSAPIDNKSAIDRIAAFVAGIHGAIT